MTLLGSNYDEIIHQRCVVDSIIPIYYWIVLSQRRVLFELEELDLTLLSSTNNMRWLYLECSDPYLDKLIFL